jgi:hypothetical protein
MKIRISVAAVSLVALLLIGSSAQAGEWRFPVGLSYISGAHKVESLFKENLVAEGWTVGDSYSVPVGLTFQPYYMVSFGDYFGLGIGVGFGPAMWLHAEDSSGNHTYDMWNVPVNASLRYIFLPKKNISPYIRTGLSYNIAGGDYYDGSNVGFVGGVGVEFLRTKAVGFGLEVAYDSSELKLKKMVDAYEYNAKQKKIRPNEIVVSLYALF